MREQARRGMGGVGEAWFGGKMRVGEGGGEKVASRRVVHFRGGVSDSISEVFSGRNTINV